MLRSPTAVARCATREQGTQRPRSWVLSKSTTKKDTGKHENKISMDKADLGIYNIKILGKNLPILGVEVGNIPLRDPNKVRKEKEEAKTNAVAKVTGANVTPPRKIETFVDQFSVSPAHTQTDPMQSAASIVGLSFNPNDHPLLCDLDEDRDAVMYGHGKEFIENVKRVRSVLVEYHRWELNEKCYKYLTMFLQLGLALLLYFIWYQSSICRLLMDSIDTYVDHVDARIRGLGASRDEALRRAVASASSALESKRDRDKAISEAQRFVRRVLLPDSSDRVAIVHARMKAYHEEKQAQRTFPS